MLCTSCAMAADCNYQKKGFMLSVKGWKVFKESNSMKRGKVASAASERLQLYVVILVWEYLSLPDHVRKDAGLKRISNSVCIMRPNSSWEESKVLEAMLNQSFMIEFFSCVTLEWTHLQHNDWYENIDLTYTKCASSHKISSFTAQY